MAKRNYATDSENTPMENVSGTDRSNAFQGWLACFKGLHAHVNPSVDSPLTMDTCVLTVLSGLTQSLALKAHRITPRMPTHSSISDRYGIN